ncbi:MAG: hypothetical protein F6J98_16295 [Moorea sp. SIO4G2]|nr:hypothetical protein [Moorena sp. SIO4G2]
MRSHPSTALSAFVSSVVNILPKAKRQQATGNRQEGFKIFSVGILIIFDPNFPTPYSLLPTPYSLLPLLYQFDVVPD